MTKLISRSRFKCESCSQASKTPNHAYDNSLSPAVTTADCVICSVNGTAEPELPVSRVRMDTEVPPPSTSSRGR